jgi:AcrR family transcriptional regulator
VFVMAVSREQIATRAIAHLNSAPAASMGEIARAAGVSRATLHRHFATREELILALGRRAHEAWRRLHEEVGLETAVRTGLRLEETLRNLVLAYTGIVEEHGFVLTEHLLMSDPETARGAEELESREIELFTLCQRAGILRADLPARWVSNTLYGLLISLRESLRRGDIARRDAPRLLLETFLRGTS